MDDVELKKYHIYLSRIPMDLWKAIIRRKEAEDSSYNGIIVEALRNLPELQKYID